MHLATLIAVSLPFLPSILSHPVVDGAEAPSRVIQRRQYDTLTADATGTGGTFPTGTSDPFPSGTGTGSLGQKSSFKLMDGGGLLAACASASLGSPSSTSTVTPLDTTDDEIDLTDSTATASAGLTLPTGTTEKRHTHPAKFSPQDFAKICSMVEKYSQKSTLGTQQLSSTTTTGDDITDDTTDDTTGETTATTVPTGTASATLPTSTTEPSSLSEKKMKRANGW